MAIKCAISGCDNEAEPFRLYCKVHSKKNVYYKLQFGESQEEQKTVSSGNNKSEKKKSEKD